MPKVTFPHLCESHHALAMLLNDLGNEVVIPPRPSKLTLDLGVKHAPEFACLPVKILLGTYLETCPQGVELIITSGGVGPCRAGHYAQLHKKILNSLGYPVDIVAFEPPRLYPLELLRNIQKLNPSRLSYRSIYECFKRAWRKLQALDSLEKLSHRVRPRELKRGLTSRFYRLGVDTISKAYTLKEIIEAEKASLEALQNIPQDLEKEVLKITIVGEVYVVLEPACNLEIEESLGYLGVEVERSMFLTGWTRDNTWAQTSENITVRDAALDYLPELLGGHGRDSIGNAILYAKRGFDGVIQLAPFTCIPEIVARTIMPAVSRDFNIPVLTFFLDEQTGKAGMMTRLEAFVDLLRYKRQEKIKGFKTAVNT
jgi:predicted nucleotide-binding protein (sugar kinase/HSP70/actin superfamily)